MTLTAHSTAAQRLAGSQEGLLWKASDGSYDRVQEVPCPTVNVGYLPTQEAELNPGHKLNLFCALGAAFNKDP